MRPFKLNYKLSKGRKMNKFFFKVIVLFLAISSGIGFFSSSVLSDEKQYVEDKKNEYWVNRIRKGGLILHFRHWQRDQTIHPAIFDSYEINNKLNARKEYFGFSTCLLDRGIAEGKMVDKSKN